MRWSDNGDLVALVCENAFYTLRFSPEAVDEFLATGQEPDEDGIEDAFELLNEVQERVRTGLFRLLGCCIPRTVPAEWPDERLFWMCVGGDVCQLASCSQTRPAHLDAARRDAGP